MSDEIAENNLLDMSCDFESGDFPCCPVCDNEIMAWEPVCLITAHGSKAAAHSICVAFRRQELGI